MLANQKVALLDWDNTLRDGFMLIDWVRYLSLRGVVDESSIGQVEQTFDSHFNGKISYEMALKRAARIYAVSLRGASVDTTRRLAKSFLEQDQQVHGFATILVSLLQEHGIKPIIVSGSPYIVLALYAAELNCDLELGLRLSITNDGTSWRGRVAGNGGLGRAKGRKVAELLRKYAVILAIGDSPSDIPLLEVATLPLLFAASVTEKSPEINLPNLTLVSQDSVIPVVERFLADSGP